MYSDFTAAELNAIDAILRDITDAKLSVALDRMLLLAGTPIDDEAADLSRPDRFEQQ